MLQIVKAPALRAAKNGLVEVGNRIDVGDEKWEDGVTFTPHGCQTIFAHSPACPSENKSPFHECTPPVAAHAWLLEVGLQWSLMDMGADPKDILTEAFEIGTSAVLERLTWEGITDVAAATPLTLPTISGTISTGGISGRVMGTSAVPPVLTTTALNVGSATNIAKAVGMVEAKLLDASDHIGGAGTIFMSPVIASQAAGAGVFDPDNLVTRATGSQVIVGNFDADTIIGVIGEVDVYLGDVIVLEANERSKNEWVGRAERRAVAVWNPCGVFSVTIT